MLGVNLASAEPKREGLKDRNRYLGRVSEASCTPIAQPYRDGGWLVQWKVANLQQRNTNNPDDVNVLSVELFGTQQVYD